MRECPDGELRELLPLFAAGRLAAGDGGRVDRHLEGCAECRAELELLRAVGRAYAVPAPDVSAIAARLPRRLPQRRAAPSAIPFHRQPLWRLAATVTLMIAATATWVAIRSGARPSTVADSAAPQTSTGGTGLPGSASEPPRASESDGSPAIRLGVGLSGLTDSQLEALIASMEGMEGNVPADPEAMVKPITPELHSEGGRN